jgi:CBS domain-containing membrane protein
VGNQELRKEILRSHDPIVMDLMTTDVISLTEDDSLETLDELMKWKHLRHVPITDESGCLVGLVTQKDFLTVAISKFAHLSKSDLSELYSSIPISQIMCRKFNTTEPDTPLSDAAQHLFRDRHGCLPVIQGHRLVGMLTESDFVKAFFDWKVRIQAGAGQRPLHAVMREAHSGETAARSLKTH